MGNIIDLKPYRAALRGYSDAAQRRAAVRKARPEIKRYRDTLALLSRALDALAFDQKELDQALESMRHGTLTEDEITAAARRAVDKVLARLPPGTLS